MDSHQQRAGPRQWWEMTYRIGRSAKIQIVDMTTIEQSVIVIHIGNNCCRLCDEKATPDHHHKQWPPSCLGEEAEIIHPTCDKKSTVHAWVYHYIVKTFSYSTVLHCYKDRGLNGTMNLKCPSPEPWFMWISELENSAHLPWFTWTIEP